MYGKGIIKGLGVTLKHFLDTYVDDIRVGKKRYTEEGVAYRSSKDVRGLFTVQYPEEKLPTPEEFRFIPFLVYDEGEDGEKNIRCTSCGICSKVCPPQCIWIVRSEDPETGRPIPEPSDFFIDVDVCMNCGMCAEFCPFDAIVMGHDYELAVYDRLANNIYDKDKLLKPAAYYQAIRPVNYRIQAEARAEKEAKKATAQSKKEA
ncbi:MAG: NADH-quinone oxidoreductase subunit I [Chloroflexi bacterium]|nr:NADH-quinone oxidoreductase subunit I [Chloroflexota bacterium]